MTRRQLMISVLVAAVVVLAAAIVTVSVRDSGSGSPAKVSSTPGGSSPAPTATPTPAATASPSPRPTRTPTPTHRPVTPTPGSQHPTSRVSIAPPVGSARTSCTVTAGAQTVAGRAVIIDLPGRFPAPVIFDYHGGGQNAAQEHSYTGLGPAGSRAGYVVVTPNATNGLWNFPAHAGQPDDVSFTQTIAAMLTFAGCSNGQLYTAGISDGADMAITAACRIPQVRGVFAVAPSITPRGPCSRKSLVEVHGTADPVVPYSGSASGSYGDTPSEAVEARLPFWTNGCAGPSQAASPGAGTQVKLWTCADGRKTQLVSVSGGGHTWPGAASNEPVANLGARAAWSANAAALAFFAAL